MANTHGFEVVAEITSSGMKQVFQAAWKSGGEKPGNPANDGTIWEFFDIPAGLCLQPVAPCPGSLTIQEGHVQIPKDELDLTLAPDVNGVNLKLGLHIQVLIKEPLVPSAGLFNLAADVHAKAPIDILDPNQKNVGIVLNGLPRGNVSAKLTSGDPVVPKLDDFLQEYVHKQYQDNTAAFPHKVPKPNLNFAVYKGDALVELFDDPVNPSRQITTSRSSGQVKISIPIHLGVYNIVKTFSAAPDLKPYMGIEARLIITASEVVDANTGAYRVPIKTTGTVDVENIIPANAVLYGLEGANYIANKDTLSKQIIPVDLENLLKQQLIEQGNQLIQQLQDISFDFPTIANLETFIADQVHQKLKDKKSLDFWHPKDNPAFPVNEIRVKALADVLAIALNPGGGADENALDNFVPAGKSFASAINGQKVLSIIDQRIHLPEDQGGFGADFPHTPKVFHDVDGHDAKLTRLDITLRDGAIHLDGDVTVIDAILGSIDVDASFEEDVGLHWEDNPDGSQHIVKDPGEPDIDRSLLSWILSFLIGFITLGLLGGVVGLVINLVIEIVVSNLGGKVVQDQVTKQINVTDLEQELTNVGKLKIHFENPIEIKLDGIVFAGQVSAESLFALTAVVPANAQGPYSISGGLPLSLSAALTHPSATYVWKLGDGAIANTATVAHTYGDDGFYIAELALTVNQPGGALSRSFAAVNVLDVPPKVDAGSDRTFNEGDVVEFTGTFTDVQWLDTHEATWYWDDYQLPDDGIITETHSPPVAQGTVTAQHAWGDAGTYTIRLRLQDDGGAIGQDSVQVTVLNVPPTVEAGPPLFAYPCSVITLTGKFTDPGWLDKHIGNWVFGDCTPAHTAIIEEIHLPPAGKGTAIASHIYLQCGTYQAICTVIDDDGAPGEDSTIIHVVQVENANFEGGFRGRRLGAVANAWEPYTATLPDPIPFPSGADEEELTSPTQTEIMPSGGLFYAEEFLVHSGERSQRIRGKGAFRAGLYQQVGANPGWDYQISAWYSFYEQAEGLARLGIDPTGGTDPESSNIVWIGQQDLHQWTQLCNRINVSKNAITLFLEVLSWQRNGADICFDDVDLIPIQPFCPHTQPEPQPKPQTTCVSFTDLQPQTEIPAVYKKKGFTFQAIDQAAQRIVSFGEPAGQSKLAIGLGVMVDLPFIASRVQVQVSFLGGQPVEVTALDHQGIVLGHTATSSTANTLQTLEISAANIVQLKIIGRSSEAALFEVCAYQE